MKAIHNIISRSLEVKQAMLADTALLQTTETIAKVICEAFKADQKVLFCGNGGSAADAQHLATELSGRFYLDRPPLYAEALNINTAYLTAVANDYGYEETFRRSVQAKGRPGDILIGLSTSGNSLNVLAALDTARKNGLTTIGFSGKDGGKMKDYCDYLLLIPSDDVPRIQEGHMLLGHIICELVEKEMFQHQPK